MASLIFITREDALQLSDAELINGLLELCRRLHSLSQDDIELHGNIKEAYNILYELTLNRLEAGRQAIEQLRYYRERALDGDNTDQSLV